MQQPPSRIRWHRPSAEAAESLSRRVAAVEPTEVDESDAVRRMVLSVGVPLVEGAETAKEYALGLLKLTAEVEHALMVQYLYAAFSLPRAVDPDAIDFHQQVMKVAIQEMGHLTTMQNLLLLLGGRDAIYMQRDLIRESSEQNPIPFVLEPVSKVSLAKYVAAEKPATVLPALEAKVAELVQLAEADAGIQTHRVGVIFELLKWVFRPPETSGEEIDFAELAPLPEKPHLSDQDLKDHLEDLPLLEANEIEWGTGGAEDVILPTVHTRAEALDALDRIARQGEGLTNGGRSHFTEFMSIVASFEAGNVSVKPIPKSPTLGGGIGELISHPYTKLWCEVFNSHYNLLILTIYHALLTPRTDEESETLRAALIDDMALFSMRRIIHPLADLITSLPLNAAGSADRAGPTFDLDASILESNNDPDLVAQHIRMLDALASVYSAIESSPDFTSFPNHANTLANLRNFDKRRRKLFTPPPPTPSEPSPIAGENKMRYRIFPSVGIARLGEDGDFFLGPERPGDRAGELQPNGTVLPLTRFKDATRTRIRKQGARFHIFESNDGLNWAPANLPADATVTWTVTLENTKSAVTRPANPPTTFMRPQVPAGNQSMVIQGGTKQITGPSAVSSPFIGPYATTAPDGSPFQVDVDLGLLRTDGQGRLIVLGGKGQSRAPAAVPLGGSFYRNPKWHDDVADGPVAAEIKLPPTATPIKAEEGAWVIIAPPDYAPGIECVVTLYDVMRQLAISELGLPAPGPPSFDLDIAPIIARVRRLRWVHADATWSDPRLNSLNLRSRVAADQQLRADVRDLMLTTESVFAGHILAAGPPFRLRSFQRKFLNDWVAGNFDDTPAMPAAGLTAEGLTRASLEGAAGQGFCPGIEAGIIVLDKTLYATPFDFRINHASVKAGEITALMAQPWQADFLKCNTEWWPTQRPDLAPLADGTFEDWVRGAAGHKLLVERHPRLGFVVQQGAAEVFLEVERDPNL